MGRSDLWINQNQNIPKHTRQTVKKILIDQFVQNWHPSLNRSSKGNYYKLLKDVPSLDAYLTIIPKGLYIPLIKYRTSNHFLPIETLRWQGIDISERKCSLCEKQDTADEYHYLLICKHFENERNLYLSPYYFKRPNILKYKELFTSKSPIKLTK